MSKTRDTGFLANVIQVHDTGVRIMSGSEMLMAISSSGQVTITGELSGSDAANSLLLDGTGSLAFTTTASFLVVSASQQQISSSLLQVSASYISLSGSYNTFSGSASTRTTQIENVYATTGSNSFRADQSITGSLVVSSTITAQTLVVQTVTSSIVYSSGSNIFGSALTNTQTFTGSMNITGSNITANVGAACFSGTATIGSDLILSATNGNIYGGTAVGSATISNIGGQTYAKFFGASHATTPNTTAFINANSTMLTISNTGDTCFANNVCALNLVSRCNIRVGVNGGYAVISGPTTGAAISLGSNSSTFDRNLSLGIVGGDLSFSPILTINAQTANVGIGMCTPDRRLYVTDTSVTQGTFLAYNQCSTFCGTVIEGITDRTSSCAFNLMNLKSSTTSMFLVRGDGNVGIGITSPATLLANTSTRPTNADGLSLNLSGLDWAVNGQGYAATIWNTSATAANNNAGLLVRICSTDATDKILDLESGGVNRFRMLGTGVTTFACQVCAPSFIGGTIKGTTGLLSSGFTPYTYNDQFEIQNEGAWRLRFQAYHNGAGYDYRIVQNNNGSDICVMRFICGCITVNQAATFNSTIASSGDITITKAAAASFIANNTSASGKSYRLVSTDAGTFIIQNTGVLDLFAINSAGVACFTSTVCTPNATIGCINSYNGIITSNGVITKSVAGTMVGATATYFDFPTWDDSGQGQMFEIKAFFDHFYNWGYGAHYYVYLTSRETNTQALTMFSCGTGNGGSWMAYKTSATNLRVCKIAGTYGGGGAYWIQVTAKQP